MNYSTKCTIYSSTLYKTQRVSSSDKIIVKENNNRIIPGTEVVYQDIDNDEDGETESLLLFQTDSHSLFLLSSIVI